MALNAISVSKAKSAVWLFHCKISYALATTFDLDQYALSKLAINYC
jgi:hypothetical protein